MHGVGARGGGQEQGQAEVLKHSEMRSGRQGGKKGCEREAEASPLCYTKSWSALIAA